MQTIRLFLFTAILLLPNVAHTVEIEGVTLPDSIQLEGKTIQLNGAGIRSKFFFDIYVAGLYLEQSSSKAKTILGSTGTRRITMDFLYDEVSKEKLTDGWNEGFEKNQSKDRMHALAQRLNQFNALFETAHKGDKIVFDFLSDGSTRVQINGSDKGAIAGADFQQALMAVWLGKKPADKGLKKSMLGR